MKQRSHCTRWGTLWSGWFCVLSFLTANARAEFVVSSQETLDSFAPMEWYESASPEVAIDQDGNAVLVYYHPDGPYALNLMHCIDPACATRAEATLDSFAPLMHQSLALDGNGKAQVIFQRRGDGEPASRNRALQVAACEMEPNPVPFGPACITTTSTQYAPGRFSNTGHVGMFDPQGRFVFGWIGDTRGTAEIVDAWLFRNDNPPSSTQLFREKDVAGKSPGPRPHLFFNAAIGGYQLTWRNFNYPGFDNKFEIVSCPNADCTTRTRASHILTPQIQPIELPGRDVALDPSNDTLVVMTSDPVDQAPILYRCLDPLCNDLDLPFDVDPAGAGTSNYLGKRMTILPDGTIFVAFVATPSSNPADFDLYVVECDQNDVCGPRVTVEAALGEAGTGTDPSSERLIGWQTPLAIDYTDDGDLVLVYVDSTPGSSADSELRLTRAITQENACSDGFDNDADGQIDCEDADCDESCAIADCPCWDGTQDQSLFPGQTLADVWQLSISPSDPWDCVIEDRCETTEQNSEPKAAASCHGSVLANTPAQAPKLSTLVESSSNPAENLRCELDFQANGYTQGALYPTRSITVPNLSRPQFRGCVNDMIQFTQVTQGAVSDCGLPSPSTP